MRKSIIPLEADCGPAARADEHGGDWIDLASVARVEITSEDREHPVEHALLPGGRGWRAAGPGCQTLRLVFNKPQSIHRVHLRFIEPQVSRTQEFVLRYATKDEAPTEVLRQQWVFSPSGSTTEVEDYGVDLRDVSTLELQLVPDIAGGDARASLTELRLA